MFFALSSRLFHSSTFRLALIYMVIFSASVLFLLGFIYWSTAGYMLRQAEATINAEIAGLVERYDLAGLPGLRRVITDRLSRQPEGVSVYLLVDDQFQPILGNLKRWPKQPPSDQGWVSFQIDPEPHEHGKSHQALAKTFQLRGKVHLLVGRDIHDLQETQALIREALVGGLLITFVLALAGGTMMSRAMMRRIEIINATCRQIMEGALSKRIPRTGGEDDFDRLVDNLNLMLDQIEELMDGVRQVTNNIAHDLRTPLTHLRRRLDVLRESGCNGENNQELLDQAIAEADGLLATFKALLRISEVEAGGRRSGFRRVDMTALLNDLIELYQPLSEEHGQSFLPRVMATRPIFGDRDLLFQAFANLLDNAIKLTPDAGQIELAVVDGPAELKVVVRDSGPGIPAEFRHKVFERFFRLEPSRSTPGNGLGLSLVAAIVKLHHGEIELSDNQPGLVVTVTLPREV